MLYYTTPKFASQTCVDSAAFEFSNPNLGSLGSPSKTIHGSSRTFLSAQNYQKFDDGI